MPERNNDAFVTLFSHSHDAFSQKEILLGNTSFRYKFIHITKNKVFQTIYCYIYVCVLLALVAKIYIEFQARLNYICTYKCLNYILALPVIYF